MGGEPLLWSLLFLCLALSAFYDPLLNALVGVGGAFLCFVRSCALFSERSLASAFYDPLLHTSRGMGGGQVGSLSLFSSERSLRPPS